MVNGYERYIDDHDQSIGNVSKKYFGPNFKPKILWMFVTENIIWSAPDRQRAENENIRIITEREFLYFRQLADHLGKAGRYQFLAEFLAGQDIPELSNKKIPAIEGTLGGHTFYCFVLHLSSLFSRKVKFFHLFSGGGAGSSRLEQQQTGSSEAAAI